VGEQFANGFDRTLLVVAVTLDWHEVGPGVGVGGLIALVVRRRNADSLVGSILPQPGERVGA